ncbi:hypothetical protein D3C78_1871770 [compost metagenome]
MIYCALTLLVTWICVRALSLPTDELQQAALLPFAEEIQEEPAPAEYGALNA